MILWLSCVTAALLRRISSLPLVSSINSRISYEYSSDARLFNRSSIIANSLVISVSKQ